MTADLLSFLLLLIFSLLRLTREDRSDFVCTKCKLVSILEETVKGQDTQVSILHCHREDEDFLDRSQHLVLQAQHAEESACDLKKKKEENHVPPMQTEAVSHILMDIAPDSFDDQYQGCREQVMEELNRGDYFQKELGNNKNYSSIWEKAKLDWSKKPMALLREMQENHAVALLAYTMNTSLHSDLNWAVSRAGTSPEHYRHNFPFKYLHFYLTTAIQLVRRWQSGTTRKKCYQVHRGVKGLYFEAELGTKVRFGRFTSTSLLRKEARRFGNETIFTLKTCLGAVVQRFSHYFSEREVLIPPYEIFQVRNFSRTPSGNRLYLLSVGNYSQYNCQLLKGNDSFPGHRRIHVLHRKE
ncbi:ecto-ADP-ribosyltransferase 4 isoform X2 [Gopherus evgoodei]|uniref:ecto-ADP-ribosyltransferase 4 isoform X2 n=1 Tax=Gopherus evgoodei TaxID=1825980 RepID=UPI0011CFDDB0|nr:ecto-ADP-ribosyltransferase 4 isoform X2 [Gopherus evgoodei]